MKFGFVSTQEGGQVFLAPPLMEQLLPGDEIEYEIVENSRGDQEAKLERLVKSEFKQFFGRVVTRGKHLFIECDDARFNRWFFVPPNKRGGLKAGTLVEAQVLRHPTKLEGKSQAIALSRLGNESILADLRAYTLKKMAIETEWSEETLAHINSLEKDLTTSRKDLTETQFVTIDSAHARDLDDAVFVEAVEDGFRLLVAIADPVATLKANEALLGSIVARSTSHYLPGQIVHMMPPSLSQEQFSLLANEERDAMIAEFAISSVGEVENFELYKGTVKSHAKLSYADVESFLNGQTDALPDDVVAPVKRLADCYQAVRQHRLSVAVDISERPDYHFELNDQQQISNIAPSPRLASQRLIEEFMLLTNRHSGAWLAENGRGFFNNHGGFRTERIGDLKQLLKHYWGEEAKAPANLDEFVPLMQEALHKDADIPLRSVLVRWLQPSKIAGESEGHLGLGFTHYAMVTSPIRRAADLLNHLIIDQILTGSSEFDHFINGVDLEKLNGDIVRGRQASNTIDLTLKTQFAHQHLERTSEYKATITQVSQAGLAIRMDETGIEGFVELKPKRGEKSTFQFEGWRLCATYNDTFFHLDMPISVKLAKVDTEKRQIKFKLA
jgi:VacB/RNase II family 3'-5' exoribonuclease